MTAGDGAFDAFRFIEAYFRDRYIAGLGAFATILAVAFDPFNQYLIDYYQENINDASQIAYLANATFYQNHWQQSNDTKRRFTQSPNRMMLNRSNMYVPAPPLDPILRANIYSSIFNPNSYQTWATPEYVCATGNCTWGPTANLEVRSLCSDITSHIQRKCTNRGDNRSWCIQTIPNSTSLEFSFNNLGFGDRYEQIMTLTRPLKPLVYTNRTTTVNLHREPNLVTLQLMMPQGLVESVGMNTAGGFSNDTKWIATECSLELYVRSINASVQYSIYQETTLATWSDTVTLDWKQPIMNSDVHTGFDVPKNTSLGVYEGDSFVFGRGAYKSLDQGLWRWMNGNVSGFLTPYQPVFMDLDYSPSINDHPFSQDILETLMLQNFANCPLIEEKFSCMMSNIAKGMSKTLRDSALSNAKIAGYNASSNNLFNPANMTIGQTLVSVVFVRVRWQWLSLSALVWISAAITWISTLILTRRANLQKWRNAILPLLFLYQGDAGEVYDYGVRSLDFEMRAKSIQTKLHLKQHRARLK